MSYEEIPILHRAFELARSGEYRCVKELEKALAAEGYTRSDPQLRGPSVRKQLRRICRASAPDILPPQGEAEPVVA